MVYTTSPFFFSIWFFHILLRRKGNKQTHAIYREKELRVTPTQNFEQQEKEGETFKSDKSLMSFNRNKSKRVMFLSKRCVPRVIIIKPYFASFCRSFVLFVGRFLLCMSFILRQNFCCVVFLFLSTFPPIVFLVS